MPEDLSRYHMLISDLFQWPANEGEWEALKLSPTQVSQFHEEGFLAGVPMFSEEQLARLQSELREIADPAHPAHSLFYEFHSNESTDPDRILFHALGAWRITHGLHDILWNPRFLVAARQLLGDRAVRFWHDQIFWKPPKQGGVVAWHQDYSYWTRTVPVAHLTCWCALDDAGVENGCLQYIPGSHRWGLLPKPVIAGDIKGISEFLDEERQSKLEKPKYAPVSAGEAVFHHPLTLHGSGANNSSRPRRAVVLNVIADGVCSDSDEPLLAGVPAISRGSRIEGQFFPLLIP